MSEAREPYSARLPLTLGFLAVFLLVGVVGAWSVGTQIAGAVVASGVVQIESDRQVVQHPDGGVVGEILARDGDQVAAGDVVVRLDGTFFRSELAVVEGQLAEVPDFGATPAYALIGADTVQNQVEGQRRLFQARRISLAQEQQQLGEQQTQIVRQIEGIEAQLAAHKRQQVLLDTELANLQSLLDRGLMQASRVLELQRESARLEGEIGRLLATIAEAETRISELAIERLRLTDGRRENAISQLRDLQYFEIELTERRISLLERIGRLDMRAPVAGTVFGSQVFALQSVIQAAEPMMYVVPGDQPFEISARINPIDIEQVFPGQPVALMFTTFNSRTTPEVPGNVMRVSADAVTDQVTSLPYYEAVIRPDPAALTALPNVTLLPGMPVETFLRTEDRTPLSYLTQPLTVYFGRAFRGE